MGSLIGFWCGWANELNKVKQQAAEDSFCIFIFFLFPYSIVKKEAPWGTTTTNELNKVDEQEVEDSFCIFIHVFFSPLQSWKKRHSKLRSVQLFLPSIFFLKVEEWSFWNLLVDSVPELPASFFGYSKTSRSDLTWPKQVQARRKR